MTATVQDLSDLVFEVREKLSDEEYKKLMETSTNIFKTRKSKFYEITHLEPRFQWVEYNADTDDEDDCEYYKITMKPVKVILRCGDFYSESIFEEHVPSELTKCGYVDIEREHETHDLLNNTMDDEIRNLSYHVISIRRIDDE